MYGNQPRFKIYNILIKNRFTEDSAEAAENAAKIKQNEYQATFRSQGLGNLCTKLKLQE